MARPALILWAVVGVLHALLAVGHYEDRIVNVTHGSADVWPAWAAYAVLAQMLPWGMVIVLADTVLVVASLVAVAWLVRMWGSVALRAPAMNHAIEPTSGTSRMTITQPIRGSLLAVVVLYVLIWLHRMATASGGVLEESAWDTRLLAYPLWTVASVMVVVSAFLGVRLARSRC